MPGKRKRYLADFKAKVALEALRGELTTAQLAAEHGVHQTMIGEWKRQAVDGLAEVFAGRTEAKEGIREGELEKLDAKIGQLAVDRVFCRRHRVDECRAAAGDDRSGASASVGGSALRAGLDRPLTFYRAPTPDTAENLALMRRLDEQFLQTP